MPIESAIEYFSVFGGVEEKIELDFFESITAFVCARCITNFAETQQLVAPSYLLESPYCDVLQAVAKGDGKYYAVLRKAKLSEEMGCKIVTELISLGILRVEASREQPLKVHPKHKLKKELRHYRIQDKLRFEQPFLRFWFGFVFPYRKALAKGNSESFLSNFEAHYERLRTLVFEQLCNDLLADYFQSRSPLLSQGSYWNHHSEFDVLAVTSTKKIILGECKYKDRKVCKNELNKLKAKAEQSGIHADIYALFSKDGFSNELLGMQSEKLLLFDLDDLKQLCE